MLLDTGAPSTIHTADNLVFCSEHFKCSTDYLGLNVAKLSDMLGTEITTLLAADILSKFKIVFDYRHGVVDFGMEETSFDGSETAISNFMGLPVIEISVKNRTLKLFLDTGATLSYIPESITGNYESIGKREDFFPIVGKFETDCYEIETSLRQHSFTANYGNLPALLQMTLTLSGADGIMGFDFFNNFKVMLDLENNRLKYSKY